MTKYIGRTIAGAAAGMAVAQPSMGMGEDGRFGAGSQTPDPGLRHLADQGRARWWRWGQWGQLPDAIRSPSSNLPPAP